jgi:hypothetical protein
VNSWLQTGTYRLHLQGRKMRKRGTSVSRWLQFAANCSRCSSLADFSTLKMEAIRSSETSVHTRSTRYIPEDGIFHTNPFHIQTHYFFKISFNTVHPSTPRLSMRSLPLISSNQNFIPNNFPSVASMLHARPSHLPLWGILSTLLLLPVSYVAILS